MTLSHHRVVSIWLRSLNINGGVLDLVLTDVPDIVVGVRVDSPAGISDNNVVFINVVLARYHC